PWYLPAAATAGVFCIVAALWRNRTAVRIVAVLLITGLAGLEWAFLFATRLPPYAGPVAVGQPFPPFGTVRADGTPFPDHDLGGPARGGAVAVPAGRRQHAAVAGRGIGGDRRQVVRSSQFAVNTKKLVRSCKLRTRNCEPVIALPAAGSRGSPSGEP